MVMMAGYTEASNNGPGVTCESEILKSDLNIVTRFFLSEQSKALLKACAEKKKNASELTRVDEAYVYDTMQDVKYRDEIKTIEKSTEAINEPGEKKLDYGNRTGSIKYQTTKSSDTNKPELKAGNGFKIIHGK